MPRAIAYAAMIFALFAFASGCSSLRNPGSPQQSFDIEGDIKELEKINSYSKALSEYYSNKSPTQQDRNKFIATRLVITDLHYVEFVKSTAVNKAQFDTALDVVTIGLDLAATLVGGPALKSILAAASAGTTASRLSYDKNFFYEKTIEVLVSAMNAERKAALVPIAQGVRQSLDNYPFETALTDLHIYKEAGTFHGGLQAIRKDAALKEAQKEQLLETLRNLTFEEDVNSIRIKAYVGWDGKDFTNKANLQSLQAWKSRNGIGLVSPASFIFAKEFSGLRAAAVKDSLLAIP